MHHSAATEFDPCTIRATNIEFGTWFSKWEERRTKSAGEFISKERFCK